MSFAAIITLIITFIYITAVASHSPNLDPSTMPMDEREALAFTHGGMGFMVYLMYSSWFFIGIETITVCGSIISNGRTIIPKVLMASITVIFVLAIVTVCMAYFGEHPKDIDRIIDTDFPLSLGMIDHLDAPEGLAVFLQLIPLFGAAMGFMYTSKRTLNSMAQSGLVNPWFKRTYGSEAVPIRAMGCSAGIQYLLLLIMHYGHVESVLFPLTMLGACGCYLGVFYSYIIFSHRFPNMDRPVKIPYGVYLAYLGIAIFALVGISILGFHDNWYVLVGLLVLFFLLAHRYYYKVVEGRQFFSKEEQKKFMKAYILNANQMRHRGGTTGAGAHSSHSHPTTTRLVTLWNEIAQKLDPSEKMLPQFHPASRGKTEMNTVGNTKQTGRTSPSKRLMSMSKRPSTLIILSNNKVTPDTTPESSPNSSPVMGTHKEHECSPSSPTAMSPRKVIPFMQPTNDAVTSNSEVPKHGRIWAMLEAGMERVWQLPILVGQYLFFTSPSPPPRFPHPITLQLLGRENDLQVPRPDGHVQGREGVMEEAVVVSEPVEIALSPSEVVDDIPLSSPLSMERQHNHPVPSKLKITWSGRALSSRDSRKLFDALTTSRDAMDLVNSLRCVLPEHFQVKEDDELGSTID